MAEMKSFLNVLCLEDSRQDAELLKELLTDMGYLVSMEVAEEEKSFVTLLKNRKFDIILADYTLPGFNASEALKLALRLQPETPFICISGTIGEDIAVELVKQGATDYVLKDRLGRLEFSIKRALSDTARKKEWEEARRQLHDQEIIRQQNEELKKLNATKDKFFAIISHDLRSPFNSILGLSQLLNMQVRKMNTEKIEQIAGIIYQSSKTAVDLISNLIEWSMSQSGTIEYRPERLNLAEVAGEVGRLFASAARQKKISLKNEVPSHLMIDADRKLLATVMRNLVSNALKFTPEGGQVKLSATEQGSEVIISVADSGIGIADDKKRTLFQIDHNHRTEGTNKEKGTGLGLILCKEFIDLHKGRIWVEGNGVGPDAGGTTFLFALPNDPSRKGGNNEDAYLTDATRQDR